MLTITWNTKRLYTREGLIRTPLPRYITGSASHYQLQDWVDTEYLHNRYDYDRSGEADRLQRRDRS